MNKQRLKQAMGLFLVLLLGFVSSTPTFQQWISLPHELRLMQGMKQVLDLPLPMTVQASSSLSSPLAVASEHSKGRRIGHQPYILYPRSLGNTWLTFKLFGALPIKRLHVRVLPETRVIPGGQSIGVKLTSAGVLVVGRYPLPQKDPSDIRVGDYIIRINGKDIRQLQDVMQQVERAGRQKSILHLTILRDGKKIQQQIRPYFDAKEKMYRLGLYIRNSTAGVGTLTFVEPKSGAYGALGHMISDVDTGQTIRIGEGKIVRSSVTSIQKGASGEPGEKRAIFFDEHRVLGNIIRNTPFGVFGILKHIPKKDIYNQPLPIAFAEEVKEGPAKILTVVEGQKVEPYDIQIMHVMRQNQPATKGLIIKVTDPKLLEKTGGIVQGMSGSPIIQNGKICGAVTHVFVNNPTTGYGTFIEWMLQDAGVMSSNQTSGSFFSGATGLFNKNSKIFIRKPSV
jgi:stage IV sporulation protein B